MNEPKIAHRQQTFASLFAEMFRYCLLLCVAFYIQAALRSSHFIAFVSGTENPRHLLKYRTTPVVNVNEHVRCKIRNCLHNLYLGFFGILKTDAIFETYLLNHPRRPTFAR